MNIDIVPLAQHAQLITGLLFGVLTAWLIASASGRWRRGRGLLRTVDKVRSENSERLWQAKSDRAQGWRELLRAVGEWSVVGVIVFLLGVVLAS